MLVLSRREKESIRIGDHITITIVTIGRQVRIGIEAPPEVDVHRGEVYKRIQRERAAADVAQVNETRTGLV